MCSHTSGCLCLQPLAPFPATSRATCVWQDLRVQGSLFNFIFFEFLKMFLLGYDCFTMLCSFLLYNSVNQLHEYV